MRSKLWIAFLFSALCAHAGTPDGLRIVNRNAELPRTDLAVYSSRTEALAGEASKYMRPLAEWESLPSDSSVRYTSRFAVPMGWLNRQVLLEVGSASSAYTVRVNGTEAGYCADPNRPCEFNLTRCLRSDGVNSIEIELLRRSPAAPLESFAHDAAPALGRTLLRSQPTIRIRDVLVETATADTTATARIGVVVKTDALNPKQARIALEVRSPEGEVVLADRRDIELEMRGEDTLQFHLAIPRQALWSAAEPRLWDLLLTTQTEGRYTEYIPLRTGFRSIAFAAENGAWLVNGEPVEVRAAAMPSPLDRAALEELKSRGVNTLIIPAGQIGRSLYPLADRLGFYLVEQAPVDTSSSGLSIRKGGNPSNDPAWLAAFIERCERCYHASKQHPSVVAFSLARRSVNGNNLYESYLHMKRLDSQRPILYPEAGGEWNSDPLPVGFSTE